MSYLGMGEGNKVAGNEQARAADWRAIRTGVSRAPRISAFDATAARKRILFLRDQTVAVLYAMDQSLAVPFKDAPDAADYRVRDALEGLRNAYAVFDAYVTGFLQGGRQIDWVGYLPRAEETAKDIQDRAAELVKSTGRTMPKPPTAKAALPQGSIQGMRGLGGLVDIDRSGSLMVDALQNLNEQDQASRVGYRKTFQVFAEDYDAASPSSQAAWAHVYRQAGSVNQRLIRQYVPAASAKAATDSGYNDYSVASVADWLAANAGGSGSASGTSSGWFGQTSGRSAQTTTPGGWSASAGRGGALSSKSALDLPDVRTLVAPGGSGGNWLPWLAGAAALGGAALYFGRRKSS